LALGTSSMRSSESNPERRPLLLVVLVALVLALGSYAACDSGDGQPRPSSGGRHAPSAAASPLAAVRGARARRMRIPILMYHQISEAPAGTPYPHLWVSPARFGSHMRALARRGYRAITLRRAYDAWHRGGALPRRPVVVSFDDGYPGHRREALPVLRRLGWPGVLNLKLGAIGAGSDGVSTGDVRELIAAGWEIDSHTISHLDLTTLGEDELEREVGLARRRLRRRFGVPADFFCYPSGRYDPTVVAAVRAAGYSGATTTVEGVARAASDPFELPRVRVNGDDEAASVLDKIRAGKSAPAPGG
jgi:peptidoglycan/xylan/chitin deacetylase (PgdA/CDA1 family)